MSNIILNEHPTLRSRTLELLSVYAPLDWIQRATLHTMLPAISHSSAIVSDS